MPQKKKTLTPDMLRPDIYKLFFPEHHVPGSQAVGLELEIWPFREVEGEPAQLIRLKNEEGTGLIQMLKTLEDDIESLEFAPTADGAPRFKISDGGQLTFEPGGQLEYSGPPKETLAEAIRDITQVVEILRCHLKKFGVWFFHSGLNPWYTVDEVGLQIDKERYIHMNNFFKTVGPYGQKMMRLSTSLQVNLDDGDPATSQRRWLAANLLAPIFTATFANSPFVHREATGAYSFRSLIWQRLDPSRAGIPQGILSETYQPCPVSQYLDFALNAWVMRLPNQQGHPVFDDSFRSFSHWMEHGYNGYFPDHEDWLVHLTTLFPEVRARGFFEVRYLDAQSKVWCSIPGILLAGLLYNAEATEEVIRIMEPYRRTLPGMLEVAAVKALDDDEIAGLAARIYRLAMDAQDNNDERVLELSDRFFDLYTSRRRNPARDLIDLNDGALFTPQQYRDFERRQMDLAGDLIHTICDHN